MYSAKPKTTILASIQAACFDIDDTLATCRLGYAEAGYFEMILAGLLCREERLLPCMALEKVIQAETAVPAANPFVAARRLGLNCDVYRRELHNCQKKYLTVHQDTMHLLKYLQQNGITIYITTNNTHERAASVLEFLNIGHLVRKIHVPETTGYRKKSPLFWDFVIQDSGLKGNQLLVIGDDPVCDAEIPRQAGFGFTMVLPAPAERRLLDDDWMIRHIQSELPVKTTS